MKIKNPSNIQSELNSYFPILDVFRGLAAFFVVLEHVRNFLWLDFPQLLKPSLFIKIIYFLSGLGHEFVLVFFVISGCVVGRIALDFFIENKKWSWFFYLFARLTRLWIALLPALILTFCLDSVSLSLAPSDSFVFNGGEYAHRALDQIVANRMNFVYLIGNLAFLQTILVPTFGSNGVLWSLSNEFWYYILFPLFLFSFTRKQDILKSFLYFSLGFSLLCLVGTNIVRDFPIWLLGVGAYYWGRNLKNPSNRWGKIIFFISLIFAGVGILLNRFNIVNGLIGSYIIGLSFSIIILVGLHFQIPKWLKVCSQFFSNFSFSLYITHAPILTLLVVPWISNNSDRIKPDLIGFLVLSSVMLLLYLCGYAFFYLTERNTVAVRIFVKRLINPYFKL